MFTNLIQNQSIKTHTRQLRKEKNHHCAADYEIFYKDIKHSNSFTANQSRFVWGIWITTHNSTSGREYENSPRKGENYHNHFRAHSVKFKLFRGLEKTKEGKRVFPRTSEKRGNLAKYYRAR